MDIQTIQKNLEQTIAGKELYLKTLKNDLAHGDFAGAGSAHIAVIEFVQLNVKELKAILRDVEACAKGNLVG